MTIIRITAEEAKTFLEALHAKCEESACGDAFDMKDWTPRGMIDVATIIREAVLEFEKARLAGRTKKVEAPPVV